MLSNIVAHTAPLEIHAAVATMRERNEFRAHLERVAPRDTDQIAAHKIQRARVVESLARVAEPRGEAW